MRSFVEIDRYQMMPIEAKLAEPSDRTDALLRLILFWPLFHELRPLRHFSHVLPLKDFRLLRRFIRIDREDERSS